MTAFKSTGPADAIWSRGRVGDYELAAARTFGPRITSLRRAGGPEQFAEIDPAVTVGQFRFRGGHRLWVGPETPAITYTPDEHDCEVVYDGETFVVRAPVDESGFVKEIAVRSNGRGLDVDHRLNWAGAGIASVAPWAITQLPLGGKLVLPMPVVLDGPQADRSLVLWPYTTLGDSRIAYREAALVIDAASGPRLKLGIGPAPTSLGYYRSGWLFTKSFAPEAQDSSYPDRGAVGQVYLDANFCELESVGPISALSPGQTTQHLETWRIRECSDLEHAVAATMEGDQR